MAKNNGIFGKKRSAEYKKIVSNVRSKLSRIQKKYGVDESDNIYVPDKSDFKNVKEYNEWVKDMKSFTSRSNKRYQYDTNKYGVRANKQELQEIKTLTDIGRKLTDKINQKIEQLPFYSNGKIVGTVKERRQMMHDPDYGGINQMSKFDFDKIKSRKHLEKRKEMAYKRSDEEYYLNRMEIMKENHIRQISMSLNSDADELVELLEKIPADDFYEMYNMFDELDFALYDSEGEYIGADDPANHVEKLTHYVNRYLKGQLDMDLKGF